MSRRSEEKKAEQADRLAEKRAREALASGVDARDPSWTQKPAKPGRASQKKAAKTSRPRELYVPPRGWMGPGGGRVGYMDPPTMWRATTVQACGMWPFAAGSGSPMT
ncbi:ATP/GTP-binding protein, partial [Streptomyces sp. NPDC003832]